MFINFTHWVIKPQEVQKKRIIPVKKVKIVSLEKGLILSHSLILPYFWRQRPSTYSTFKERESFISTS
jgi:hypothetical protein